MKKIMIMLAVLVIMFSCEVIPEIEYIYLTEDPGEEIPTSTPDSPLIGSWYRGLQEYHFTSEGTFTLYDDGLLIDDGFYNDHDTYVYLEDTDKGVSQTYYYEIVEVLELGEVWKISIFWHVSGGLDVELVKYIP